MRIGSLFSGAGMLDEGVRSVLGGTVAWHAEVDPAACRVLAHRYPHVPNLGDVTAINWRRVEPVDVLTGGSPCQDVSHAGKRAGMRAGTRSGLWAAMCDAIDILRPRLVVWENVRGVLSAEADSGMEPCPGCVGGADDGAVLRALGRVLGDLAGLGYDTRWCGLRAADVGAPHGRFRVFVVAHDTDSVGREHGHSGQPRGATVRPSAFPATDASGIRRGPGRVAGPGETGGGWALDHLAGRGGTPTADALSSGRDGRAHQPQRRPERRTAATGDSAHTATDAAISGRPDEQDSSDTARLDVSAFARASGRDSTGNPAPRVRDVGRTAPVVAWGPYEPAIRRWERALGRVAPAPTETAPRGGQRLSPRFVEWLMGWPEGWVTDVPAVTRNDQLKICGNGVVPQQAAAALRRMLNAEQVAA